MLGFSLAIKLKIDFLPFKKYLAEILLRKDFGNMNHPIFLK